jgi:hypothetical protein
MRCAGCRRRPSPGYLQDWGRLQGTVGDSWGLDPRHKAMICQPLRREVARRRKLSKRGRIGFDSHRLHHPLSASGPDRQYNMGMVDGLRNGPTMIAGRATWPVRKYRLGQEPSGDLSGTTTPRQRLEMMWPLTIDAWSLTGRSLPDCPRHAAPVKCVRRKTS